MKGLPWRTVLGLNLVLVLGIALWSGAAAGGTGLQTFGFAVAIIMPLTNLGLGMLSLFAMFVLQFTNPSAGKVADRFMQAFMIGFAGALMIAIPSCFAAIGAFR